MSKFSFFFAFLCVTCCSISAQTINGYITEAESGEALIGVQVVDTIAQKATSSNDYGFFSLSVNSKKAALRFSYVGHQSKMLYFELQNDTTVAVSLPNFTLNTVTITANKQQGVQQQILSGVISIPVTQIEKVPTMGGENDVMKVLATTPGVSAGIEGTTGLLVRGGSPDQNLVLLDDAVVYNIAHVNGFLSVFNTDALNNVSLYKDGFPARYGGRLSSVLDISMKEGNRKTFASKIDMGVLAGGFLLEGPLKKQQSSFLITARASTLGLLKLPDRIAFAQKKRNDYNGLSFYDLNAKINYRIDDKSRLFLSFYNGYDQNITKTQIPSVSLSQECLNWGNTTLSTRYSRIINPKLFGKAILAYVKYRYQLSNSGNNQTYTPDTLKTFYDQRNMSQITDLSAKVAFDYTPTSAHYLRFGADATQHYYTPNAQIGTFNSLINGTQTDTTLSNTQHVNAKEFAAYVEDEWQVYRHFKLNVGVHYSGFIVEKQYYQALEPRLNLYHAIGNFAAIKLSYSFMQQYIHLLTNYAIGYPNDIWVPATASVMPQNAHQVALSLDKTFNKLQIDAGLSAYYKKMNHVIDYRDGSSYLFNYTQNWEDLIATNGKGEAYGIEAWIHRKTGKLNGWANYTLAYNNRQFADINDGNVFAYNYDQRHTFNIVLNWTINKHYSLSANWTYRTGRPVTLPTNVYQADGIGTIYVFDSRNNYRLPNYHRADVAINYQWNSKKNNGTNTLSIGAYNVYNRANPHYLSYHNFPSGTRIYQSSLIPIFPFLNYSRSFCKHENN